MGKKKQAAAGVLEQDEPVLDAQIERMRPNRDFPGAFVVWARCPYCEQLHQHGIYGLVEEPGMRVPDCNDWSPSYRLLLP